MRVKHAEGLHADETEGEFRVRSQRTENEADVR